MAPQEALVVLSSGVDVWNVWRSRNPRLRPDLNGVDLSGRTLFAYDLTGVILNHANLAGADLFAANVFDASFIGADLRGAKLEFALGLTQHQVDSAHGDEETVLPAGITRPAHWRRQP